MRVKIHFQVDPGEVLQVTLEPYHWLCEGHKPRDPDAPIHLVMPDLSPMATILSELVRTHKYEVRIFNEYHAVNSACKK